MPVKIYQSVWRMQECIGAPFAMYLFSKQVPDAMFSSPNETWPQVYAWAADRYPTGCGGFPGISPSVGKERCCLMSATMAALHTFR
jgi:hypothetical protein